jgi:hypothetical protein
MERKAFNFYKSYYEVFKMLENDEDKLQFITALLEKQFENKEPGKMLPMATFAYKSQEHNIIAQVEGFINKIKPPTEGGRQGGIKGGSVQEKEKEEVKEKVKVKEKVQFVAPTIDEVIKFFDDNGYTNGDKAWNYYNDGNWKDSNGKQVINWKQKMRIVWFKDENKKKAIRSIHDQDKRTREILGL